MKQIAFTEDSNKLFAKFPDKILGKMFGILGSQN